MHRQALKVLTEMSREPISEDTTPRVPCSALRNPVKRERVKRLLDELMCDLLDDPTGAANTSSG
jgi:hypothetical protein